MNACFPSKKALVGVGLRHAHFLDALAGSSAVDFVEIHSENFFAKGGALQQIITDIAQIYPVSMHSTAMGLASMSGIPEQYLEKLEHLSQVINPFLMSDHACFAWGQLKGQFVHAGDLLPIVYDETTLEQMSKHVDAFQQRFGRRLLIENLSAYIALPGSTMTEKEFLLSLVERTECGLLIDLNNILVNEHNSHGKYPLEQAKKWLEDIPAHVVGEVHLAGFTQPQAGDLVVDDHSHPVSDDCWALFRYAIEQFGAVPTLIEWDNQIPTWQTLEQEAEKAKAIIKQVLGYET